MIETAQRTDRTMGASDKNIAHEKYSVQTMMYEWKEWDKMDLH